MSTAPPTVASGRPGANGRNNRFRTAAADTVDTDADAAVATETARERSFPPLAPAHLVAAVGGVVLPGCCACRAWFHYLCSCRVAFSWSRWSGGVLCGR